MSDAPGKDAGGDVDDGTAGADDDATRLLLRYGGRLVEQLGAQMYPSATATVAELISNAWDADATNVWVQIPFGKVVGGQIVVTDDGTGMTFDEARTAYLVIGRNRRRISGHRTAGGRLVHGRKGIGKLAAFGTANILEVRTKSVGKDEIAFRLNYDTIRKLEPDEKYEAEPSEDPGPLMNPFTGEPLAHGTRVRLSELRLKRELNEAEFYMSMSRRFAINAGQMQIHLNRTPLQRFDMSVDIRFPRDGVPPGAAVDGDWAVESIEGGHEVRWWIGFTDLPIKDDTQQGVSVIVRGRLAQRPFKFERSGGTADQLGQEYLVGEVVADWIDAEAADDDLDYIQSNRDQLQLENDDLKPFLEWGRERVRWALLKRGDIKRDRKQGAASRNPALDELLRNRPKRERTALDRVAAAVARLPEVDEDAVVRVMEAVLDAREDSTTAEVGYEISLTAGDPAEFLALLRELTQLDARRTLTFVDARLEALEQLKELEPDSVADIVGSVLEISPGLIDPSWDLGAVSDLGEVAPGVRKFLIPPHDGARPGTVVLTVAPAASAEAFASLEADARLQHDGFDVLVIGPADPGQGTFREWAELVERAERLHRDWRAAAAQRLANVPTPGG